MTQLIYSCKKSLTMRKIQIFLTVRHIGIEQNRCAMACQGYDAVFFLLK